MASGRVHARYNRYALLVVTAAWLSLVAYAPHLLFATMGLPLGAVIGSIITPDFDLSRTITYTERQALRRWGVVGRFFIWYWQPYGRKFYHRHTLSHAPVVSTLLRVVYFVCPPVFHLIIPGGDTVLRPTEKLHALLAVLVWTAGVVVTWRLSAALGVTIDEGVLALNFGGFVIGWVIQDILHFILDI